MKLTKQIDFQRVGELSHAMMTGRATRNRFSIEISDRDCANGLYAAMKTEVESRGGAMTLESDMRSYILEAARWLVDTDGTPGLLLCGSYGNGKTTLAKAIALLIGFLSERELGYSNRKQMKLYTAKEICRMCMMPEYGKLFGEEMIIIDDLGEEPKEVLVYGMVHTPIVDLVSERYARQRMTVMTTNLDADELKERYGKRIYDRLREMVTMIVFENESYRKPKGSDTLENP